MTVPRRVTLDAIEWAEGWLIPIAQTGTNDPGWRVLDTMEDDIFAFDDADDVRLFATDVYRDEPDEAGIGLSARDVGARDALLALADLMDEMANGAAT